jgi:hypothetical protein
MNLFDHKDLENRLLQLCPKVVKHPVYRVGRAWGEGGNEQAILRTPSCSRSRGQYARKAINISVVTSAFCRLDIAEETANSFCFYLVYIVRKFCVSRQRTVFRDVHK